MCGIFALLNHYHFTISDIENEFMKGKNRGPEFSKLETNYLKMILGFHRLAINGLNSVSNQPLVINNIVLICNGEIYNFKEIYLSLGIVPKTASDCEVIIHLYLQFGIDQTLSMIDGVFSFILFDNRITDDLNNKIYIARDPFGVRPLYCLKNTHEKEYGFASELKCLEKIYNSNTNFTVEPFKPGTYTVFNLSNKVHSVWEPLYENIPYFVPQSSYNLCVNKDLFENTYKYLSSYFQSTVYKRCITTERPIACLLSGGLDSSLVTALVNNYYKQMNIQQQLETYSIGLAGSEDLKYAKMVAEYLGTNHTEIIVTEKEMFDIIPEVIYAIESYDTTTVRASIGNYLLGKYIKTNSDAKVIFNGDGSDELFGGYLYMNNCPNDIEFDKEGRRLLKDIHLFDVLRSDKSISSNGLEPRTPFLDKSFVNYVLSISPNVRNHKNTQKCEKYLLRESFTKKNFVNWENKQILPDEILWRKKEAFSDGVSSYGNSLYNILQNQIANYLQKEPNIKTEKYYYNLIFDEHFPNCQHLIPYFWMPKYTDAEDPSARTLSFYEIKNT